MRDDSTTQEDCKQLNVSQRICLRYSKFIISNFLFMDKLDEIFRLQKLFGGRFTKFGELTEKEQQEKTLEFISHTIEELIEMRRELPSRKDWSSKKDNPPDKGKLADELSDVIHFVISLALINNWTADDIYNKYIEKNQENIKRQKNGY